MKLSTAYFQQINLAIDAIEATASMTSLFMLFIVKDCQCPADVDAGKTLELISIPKDTVDTGCALLRKAVSVCILDLSVHLPSSAGDWQPHASRRGAWGGPKPSASVHVPRDLETLSARTAIPGMAVHLEPLASSIEPNPSKDLSASLPGPGA